MCIAIVNMLVFAFLDCDYTYSLNNNPQIEFSSPNFLGDGYPLAQKCTWRFVAPETETVHIRFLEVDIEEGDSIDIKVGWNSGTNIGTIQKSTPPNPDGYSFRSNILYMVFRSVSSPSSRKKSKGFRAIVTDSSSESKVLFMWSRVPETILPPELPWPS